jgi:hypothetical protein
MTLRALTLLLTAVACSTGGPPRVTSIDDALPRPEQSVEVRREYSLIVSIRFTSEDTPEQLITLAENSDRASATGTSAVGEPLWKQIERGGTLGHLHIATFHDSDTQKIKSLLSRLRLLRISAVPTTTMYLHPDTINIWITTRGGETHLELSFAPTYAVPAWGEETSPQNELVEWAREVQRAIRKAT